MVAIIALSSMAHHPVWRAFTLNMETLLWGKTYTIGLTVASLLLTFGSAWGANADETVKVCRAAIAEAEGRDYSDVALKKIKPRGNSYEAWFNVSDSDEPLKSYCYIKRGEVEQLVTTDGRWTSSNPKRPKVEKDSETELAQKS